MISVVVPVYNEEESVNAFYKGLIENLPELKDSFEIIFVDDGSTDKTPEVLKSLRINPFLVKASKRQGWLKGFDVRIFSFRKNQGKAEALTFGFQKAKGDYVVTLDADLQDRPDQIEKLLVKLKDGWDLVCGWRKTRNDPLTKVISSGFFNFLASKFWGLNLHDYNCGLKAYTKDVAKSLNLYGGFHRFIPLLVCQQGFKVCEVPVEHDRRKYGKSKYGFSKLWRDLPDLFTMLFLSKYSERPMHLFGLSGLIAIVLGFGILVYLTAVHLQGHAIARRPILFLGILLVLSGFQLLFTGFLADLILHNSRNSKPFESENNSLLKYSSEKN